MLRKAGFHFVKSGRVQQNSYEIILSLFLSVKNQYHRENLLYCTIVQIRRDLKFRGIYYLQKYM